MPKVTFGYDIKKDAWSWVLIAKNKDCWGIKWEDQVSHIPNDLLKKILKNPHPKAEKLVVKHLENHQKREYREKVIKEEIKTL